MTWSTVNGTCSACGAEGDEFDGICWDCYDQHWSV